MQPDFKRPIKEVLMSTLGKNIAAYRKNTGLTQEKLAEMIGISPQSVSKWENDVSLPDTALLPVLAEIFSVSIDALFGTATAQDSNKENSPKTVFDFMLKTIFTHFGHMASSDEFKEYETAVNAPNAVQTALFTETNGALWGNENIGIIFRHAPEVFLDNLADLSEETQNVLSLLSDPASMSVLRQLLQNPIGYSAAYLAKKCALDPSKAEEILEKLSTVTLAEKVTHMIDDEPVAMWKHTSSHKMLFIYTIFLMAEKIHSPDNYYCYSGSERWCK